MSRILVLCMLCLSFLLSVETLSAADSFCTRCGAVIHEKNKFCGECGQRKIPFHDYLPCIKCGAPLKKDDKFCGKCGGKAEISKFRECPSCGKWNMASGIFCGACGKKSAGENADKQPEPVLKVGDNRPSDVQQSFPPAFSNRTLAGRKKSVSQYNRRGNFASEAAVLKALRWLQKTQNEDGSWGDLDKNPQGSVAATSVATLAFLAHGETLRSEEFGTTVTKALQKLCDWVDTMKSDKV